MFCLFALTTYINRKRKICQLYNACNSLSKRRRKRSGIERRLWIRPGRTSAWWDNFVSGVVVAEEWKENFRMSKPTFDKLCGELKPLLKKQATCMRSPVSVEKQVAIALYYLADEGHLRKVANAFGVSIECSFGRLKARFGALKRPMDINLDDLPLVIYACFVLHNYCELNGESVSEERVRLATHYDRYFQPNTESSRQTSTVTNEAEGKRVRKVLTIYFDP